MSLHITVIGTGYVGLVTGTGLAEVGFNVTCVDVDAEKIRKLRDEGIIPIYEPGLEELVKKNAAAGRLTFTTDVAECTPQSDVVMIGVGTPPQEDGSTDLSYVEQAARDVASHLKAGAVVVCKSTVPVGTNHMIYDVIEQANSNAQFAVASNPEFLREGAAVRDFLEPERVVIGVEDKAAQATMEQLYQPFKDAGSTIQVVNIPTAELIKYASNSFLAVKITFINEIAALCETCGADVAEVARGMGLDSRIGSAFLNPGPGYGGSCFPKDTLSLAYQAQQLGSPQTLVEQTITANDATKTRMVQLVKNTFGDDLSGKKIAILGLAFKAKTDDMREAASLTILPQLAAAGAELVAYDPEAMENAKALLPAGVQYADSAEAALQGADGALILTEWSQFAALQPEDFVNSLNAPTTVVDTRNLFCRQTMAQAGIRYVSLGRPTLSAQTDSSTAAAA